jgi:hypothetical protein
MSGKKDPGGQWRQASVVIRSDILLKASEMGLDISDELNQRLAELVGIDYPHQQLTYRPPSDQTHYTADSEIKGGIRTKQKPPSSVLHPVINADDPAAAAKVRKTKREIPPEPVPAIPVPSASHLPETDIPPVHPVPKVSQRGGAKSGEPKKKGKDDGLKKFVITKITRIDADDAVLSKDDMYQAFTRWCRDHRIAPVPERRVFATLLKNKFAITDKTVNGTSCWVNVRLR